MSASALMAIRGPKKLKWARHEGDWDPHWITECGTYRVWVQGRPLDGTKEWGAALTDGFPNQRKWLAERAGSLREAKGVCQGHADGAP